MFSYTLFKLGPYNVCLWNILFLSILFFVAMILRRIIHKSLKNYLKSANISVEGRRETWLKLLSQSVYILATYIAVLSFSINNEKVTFIEFLNFQFIEIGRFSLSFHHLISIVVIFFGARVLLNFSKLYISRKFRNSPQFDPGKEFIYVQIARYIIYVFAIITALQALEIDLTIFLTGSAALLVGIGLGLQDVFKDMISGVVLLIEGNIRIGDIVELSNGGKSEAIVAKILKINVRTTQIETRDGNVLIIPNTKLTQDFVENWSHGSELTRFRIALTIEYGSNTELVIRLLKQAALGHPKVRKTHPVDVRLAHFGQSGLEIELIFWADQSWDINNYKSDIRFEIDRLFRANGITIPYPHTTVNLKSNDSLSAS
jgi:small-conductance mechanosensitive channel